MNLSKIAARPSAVLDWRQSPLGDDSQSKSGRSIVNVLMASDGLA
jgi:hypothetical protein